MPWVTINGNHVLIGEDGGVAGGGHKGAHNPATSTGNKVSDAAVNQKHAIVYARAEKTALVPTGTNNRYRRISEARVQSRLGTTRRNVAQQGNDSRYSKSA